MSPKAVVDVRRRFIELGCFLRIFWEGRHKSCRWPLAGSLKDAPRCEPPRRLPRSRDRPSMIPSSQMRDCGHLLCQDRFAPSSPRSVQVPNPSGQRGVAECVTAEDHGSAGCELPSVGANAAARSRARHRIPGHPAILRSGNSEGFAPRARLQSVRWRAAMLDRAPSVDRPCQLLNCPTIHEAQVYQ